MQRIRDAQTIIGALEGGDLAQEMSVQITGALAQLKELTGGRPKAKAKGKVVLTLDIEVEGSQATITGAIEAKVPKPARGSSFYWVLDDGSLSTEHPQQMNMFAGPRPLAAAGDA
ncbi:hypothetical protein [Xanthobacter tagetidis]|uniref:Uncharacterized protein n=1 Tax=Xanthobacter tagetidis TaxID=60216 RepID=A0A3L7AKM7_9HYPH|nr:hypothetical protein [Xanthobacter tagetidis]MBB6308947.1 hypothetical protein [Xanthobacter tagetidis]RLP80545.1 hypothetical protein D9R14_05720 [Xanthobacter tagetidis]